MNRIQEISNLVVQVLADGDTDEPIDEAIIHASVNYRITPKAMVSEFADALRLLETERYITGIHNRLKGPRWMLTDKGKASRHV